MKYIIYLLLVSQVFFGSYLNAGVKEDACATREILLDYSCRKQRSVTRLLVPREKGYREKILQVSSKFHKLRMLYPTMKFSFDLSADEIDTLINDFETKIRKIKSDRARKNSIGSIRRR